MPSYSISLGLLIFLGGMLASAKSNPANFVSPSLRKTFDAIQTHLQLTELEVNQIPPFTFVIDAIKSACKIKDDIHLMNLTLGIYKQIFSRILPPHNDNNHTEGLLDLVNKSEKERVHRYLENLQDRMNDLSSRLNPNPNWENALSELNRIKEEVDNPLMQRKVLAQFLQIYQLASSVAQARSPACATSA